MRRVSVLKNYIGKYDNFLIIFSYLVLKKRILKSTKISAQLVLILIRNRNAYNMVLHKYGDRLYEGLKEVVNLHLKDVAEKVASANDLKFLDSLNEAWSDHKISMLMIRDILMYMVIIEDQSF